MQKTAIISGDGELPKILAENIDNCIVVALENTAGDWVSDYHHVFMNFGNVGKTIKYLKDEGVSHIVLAGGLQRPVLSKIRPDVSSAKLLLKLLAQKLKGDNAVLSTVIRHLEKEGFTVVGADEICPVLLATEGIMGDVKPTKQQKQDIEIGVEKLKEISPLDMGQAIIIEEGRIIGIEGGEGTNGLISRCGELLRGRTGGVLVKTKKIQQDRRVDLPTIGIYTIEQASQNGLAGIAVEAGNSLILHKDSVIKRANELGVFLCGV